MLAGISDSQAHRSVGAAPSFSLCSTGGLVHLLQVPCSALQMQHLMPQQLYYIHNIVYMYCSCYEAQIMFAFENFLVVRFTDDHRLYSCVHAHWYFLTRKRIVPLALVARFLYVQGEVKFACCRCLVQHRRCSTLCHSSCLILRSI